MRLLRVTAFAATVLVIAPVHADAFKKERLVVLLDGGAEGAPLADVSGGVADVLGAKGYEVLAGPKVEAFARAQGITDLLRLPANRAADLVTQYRADGLLVIRVTFYLPESDRRVGPRANAALGVAAERRGRDGRVDWRGTASALADDAAVAGPTVAPRSLAESLIGLACERVLWSLPRAPPDPALVAMVEQQRRKAAAQAAPTWAPRRPPDREKAEALLKTPHSFRDAQPRFRLRIGKARSGEAEAAPKGPPPPSEDSFEYLKKKMREREEQRRIDDERAEAIRRAGEARAAAVRAEVEFRNVRAAAEAAREPGQASRPAPPGPTRR